MKINQVFSALAALFFVAIFSGNVVAQQTGNPQVCSICNPEITAINPFYGQNCATVAFGANTRGSGKCKTVGYEWSTSDLGAQIMQAQGQCLIRFSGPGIYTVCCTYTKWFDLNNNSIIDAGETCSDTECITIEICL